MPQTINKPELTFVGQQWVLNQPTDFEALGNLRAQNKAQPLGVLLMHPFKAKEREAAT